MKLVIFDLDETLVNFFAIHDKAFALTLEELFGITGASYKHIDYAGKRIPDSIAEYARKEGVTPQVISMNLEEAERVYELHFARLMRNPKKHILPGAVPLLKVLSKKHKLALVTADIPGVTALVLDGTGLLRYFNFVVTADDAPTRPELVAKAIKKAGKVDEVWVIGDSVRDIDAGNANGAKVIAVLTGGTPEKVLAERKPAYIFKDLTPTRKILGIIG